MNEEFVVLQLRQDKHKDARKPVKSANISVVEDSAGKFESVDYGAIAMLEPPQKKGLKLRQIYVRMKYWIKDTIDPCRDHGGNLEVSLITVSMFRLTR